MAGGDVPYHLRVNKAIDRQVFVDALVRYHGFHCLREHAYVSFGGAFLADYRILDAHISLDRMISLESDPRVFKRQSFNRPGNHIECRLLHSSEFVQNIDTEEARNFVIWLDYADAARRTAQLGEVESLVSKLPAYAVLKVTLNANVDALRNVVTDPAGDLTAKLKKRLDAAEAQLGDYWDPQATVEDMKPATFPRLLLACLRRAVAKGLSSRLDVVFEPITAFSYSDGHWMLTLTGALVPKSSRQEMRRQMSLGTWPLAYSKKGPIPICAPVLSSRERAHLESRLPLRSGDLRKIKTFSLGKDDETHKERLMAFARFAKYYPQFSRIIP